MRADKLKKQFEDRLKRRGKKAKDGFDSERYDSVGGIAYKPATLSWGYPDRVVIAESDAGKITVSDLQKIAREKGIPYSGKNKAELIEVLSNE